MAPEVMNSGEILDHEVTKRSYNGYGHSADWWSLGVIVYSMKFLRKPFVQPDSSLTNRSDSTEKEPLVAHLCMER